MKSILVYNAQRQIMFGYVTGFLDCNPQASKREAMVAYQERYNDYSMDISNLYRIYSEMLPTSKEIESKRN